MSTNQNLMQHMRELIDCIKTADVAYYRDDNPTMTDREYDLLVDELKELEATTGLILSGSPTQTVSGEILKELTPVRHTKPMLSADKTKSVDEMLQFANGRPVVLSWKLDGLTLVLRYEGGEFKQAITRGREGIIGEDVTHTVRTFMNELIAFEWAESHIFELNARCNDAIGQGLTEIILTADELPARESWENVCMELQRAELEDVECISEGIKINLSH